MCHTLDVYAGALASAVGTLSLRSEISQPPRDDLVEAGDRSNVPNFSGKWWIESSENLDAYLKAMGMGRIKRGTIAAKASFTQDIKQVRDVITIRLVGGDGAKGDSLVGPFQLGSYDVVKMRDLVGDEVILSTKWNGSTLMETQKGPRGTAECSRYLVFPGDGAGAAHDEASGGSPKGKKGQSGKRGGNGRKGSRREKAEAQEVRMVLEFMFEGTFMKQIYKRVGVTTLK
jgi:hypothetical protein